MKRFAAEVLFRNPDDVPNVRAVLAEADCELVIDHDAIDDESNYLFGMITCTTELAEDDTRWWLYDLIRPTGAEVDILEWGYGEPWRPSEQ